MGNRGGSSSRIKTNVRGSATVQVEDMGRLRQPYLEVTSQGCGLVGGVLQSH